MNNETTNPIAAAVEPQRAAAIAATMKGAADLVATMTAEMEAAGMNMEAVAPRPRNNMSARGWKAAETTRARYTLIFSVGAGDIATLDAAKVEKFTAAALARANDDYDAFIAKLVEKVGACDSAVLSGDHVWSKSSLTVTKGETVEVWTTKRILNVSVNGNLFNQWPTRKAK
jgi:hypothetical protein